MKTGANAKKNAKNVEPIIIDLVLQLPKISIAITRKPKPKALIFQIPRGKFEKIINPPRPAALHGRCLSCVYDGSQP